MNWHLSRLGSALSCVAVFGFGLGVLLPVLVFALFFLFGGGFVTAYWTVHRSFTSSLLRPLNQQTAMFALINYAT